MIKEEKGGPLTHHAELPSSDMFSLLADTSQHFRGPGRRGWCLRRAGVKSYLFKSWEEGRRGKAEKRDVEGDQMAGCEERATSLPRVLDLPLSNTISISPLGGVHLEPDVYWEERADGFFSSSVPLFPPR